MSIDTFIANALAQVDDLSELKVCVVALRLLEQKQSLTAHVTFDDLANHAALRDGLGFPFHLKLESALRYAVARGTLLASSDELRTAKIFANNAQSLALLDQIHQNAQLPDAETLINADIDAVANEIAKLEALQVAALSDEERELVGEWRARGYTRDELLAAVRASLKTPRRSSAPPRTLKDCARQLTAHMPKQPSDYERAVIHLNRDSRFYSYVISFRDLFDRKPNHREFSCIVESLLTFGEPTTIETMRKVKQHEDFLSVFEELIEPKSKERLSEQGLLLRQVLALYSQVFGLPPTATMANEIESYIDEEPLLKSIDNWQSGFEFARAKNVKGWGQYLRKMFADPSPKIFVPEPSGEIARFVFNQYRLRIGTLNALVAREINDETKVIFDLNKWNEAFDIAARANALHWNYIKSVIRGMTFSAETQLRQQSTEQQNPNDKDALINKTVQSIFEIYRKRIGKVDDFVAKEIRAQVQEIPDIARWNEAFDEAGNVNKRNWKYIKEFLTGSKDGGAKYGKQAKSNERKRTGTWRLEQVEYNDEQRAAARERAKQRIAAKKQNVASNDSHSQD